MSDNDIASTSNEALRSVQVANVEEVPVGQMKRFMVEGRGIVLANVDGDFYAFADHCQHWGVRLSDGVLEGCVVRCRAHGWRHDIKRGEVVESEPPGDEGQRIPTFPVNVIDGVVFVAAKVKRRQ
jgi:3-phenylpropionate/trans-cinnamate dioxygenase ferredoxin component